jgi:hypothetical protein
MGYSLTNKQSSNDNFFVKYLWKLGKKVSVVGSKHAVDRLIKGFTLGIDTNKKLNLNLSGTFTEYRTSISIVAVALLAILLTAKDGVVGIALLKLGTFFWEQWWNILPGPRPLYTKISAGGEKLITNLGDKIADKILPAFKDILGPIAIYLVIQDVFKWSIDNLVNKNFVFQEDCTKLFKFKNSNQYIFTGNTIYRQ